MKVRRSMYGRYECVQIYDQKSKMEVIAWKTIHKWKDNIENGFWIAQVWIVFVWLSIATGGGLL